MSSKKWVHTMRMPIRWGDMDAMGHVNNTNYFRYIESARIAWLEQVGGLPDARGEGPVIVNASMNFLKQLTYPADIEVRTFVSPPGRSSVEVSHEIRLVDAEGQPGELHAEGAAKVVWVDFTVGKSAPLPEVLRAATAVR
ncbi:acyl-CoA thioesterase [Telluria beijingensis]|uniref:acyl-CoA thioesterase n=1 Tax=Telluria beijingensis TaxID=3068633 RepID=UPI002795D8F9|nr:thioesterase family protein [Massilia sp. REN29]